MYEPKQVTGGRAGIGTVVFGVGLGLALTTLWGLRYRRTHRFAATYDRSPIRPLGRTVAEHDQSVALGRAALLKDYARFLSENASKDEAVGILEEAKAHASPDLYEALGVMKLGQGDNKGAARAYAVVASDPNTPRSRADSLARLVGHTPDGPEWNALLEAARAEVLALVLSDAVEWAPEARLRALPPDRARRHSATGGGFGAPQPTGSIRR